MRAFSLIVLSIFILLFSVPQVAYATANGKFVVIIDPGHGGTDVGTPHRSLKMDEKHIALKVATRLGNSIAANYSDVKVVYTRSTDKTLALASRTAVGKENKGDLFISIHVNACPDASARGIETYVFGVSGLQGKTAAEQQRIRQRMEDERENIDISGRQVNFDTDIDLETKILCQTQREKHNKYSREFADLVQQNMISQVKKTSYAKSVTDRGVKAKNLFVLCYSPMPSILVEVGYLSNAKEEAFMNTDEALDAYATALYNSFRTYKGNWDKRQLNGNAAEASAKEDVVQTPAKTEAKTEPKKEVKQEPKTETKAANKTENGNASKLETKKDNSTAAKSANKTVVYKIQFLISPTQLATDSKKFKGLKPVSFYKDGKSYKYTYGQASSVAGLNEEMKKVKKLFPDAFIIKTDANGNRIK